MHIRRLRAEDWGQVWPMLQATFASGDTYAFAPDATKGLDGLLDCGQRQATAVICFVCVLRTDFMRID